MRLSDLASSLHGRRRGRHLSPKLREGSFPPCSSRLSCDLANLTLPEFLDGIGFGFIALVVGVLVSLAARRWSAGALRPLPIGGILLGLGYLGTLLETDRLLPSFALAIAVLAASGLTAERLGWRWIGRALAAIPGAYLLTAHAGLVNPTRVLWVVAVATVTGAALIPDIDERGARLGVGPVLYTVSVVGMYETVPDPKLALALLGMALPLLLLGWPVPFARLGGAGASIAAGMLAWAAAIGGTGRVSAVYGGVACLGILVAEPVARLLGGSPPPALGALRVRPGSTVFLALAQTVVVYVTSRVAGLNHDARTAGIVSLVMLCITVVAFMIANRVAASVVHSSSKS
jgi:hypothetical protein